MKEFLREVMTEDQRKFFDMGWSAGYDEGLNEPWPWWLKAGAFGGGTFGLLCLISGVMKLASLLAPFVISLINSLS